MRTVVASLALLILPVITLGSARAADLDYEYAPPPPRPPVFEQREYVLPPPPVVEYDAPRPYYGQPHRRFYSGFYPRPYFHRPFFRPYGEPYHRPFHGDRY